MFKNNLNFLQRTVRITNEEVSRRCGVESLEHRLRKTRLRWFGHVKHRDESSIYMYLIGQRTYSNGHVGIEGNSGSDGKGKWSEMVYGHVLRRDDGHVLRKALEFEVKGKRKRGRPKKTWKTQVEKESKSVGLEKDAMNQARWRVGVGDITVRVV